LQRRIDLHPIVPAAIPARIQAQLFRPALPLTQKYTHPHVKNKTMSHTHFKNHGTQSQAITHFSGYSKLHLFDSVFKK
jgi:hypothetical protein